jgi:hypothetical protein
VAALLQPASAGAWFVSALFLAQGLNVSSDGRSHALVTYVVYWGFGGLLAAAAVVLTWMIHRSRTGTGRQGAALPRSEDEMARELEGWNQALTSCLKQHGFLHPSKRQSQPDDLQPARDCFYGEDRHTRLMELLRHSDRKKWTSEDEWFGICAGPQTPDEFWRVTGFLRRRFIQPWRVRQG